MRISGKFYEGILLTRVPFVMLLYLLSHFISIPDGYFQWPTFLVRLLFFSGMLFIGILADKFTMPNKKLGTLFINDKILLDNCEVRTDDILSIEFIPRRRSGFNTVLFEIKQEGEIKEVCIMDKPKFSLFLSSEESKTLEYLYGEFPELKQKEIQKP